MRHRKLEPSERIELRHAPVRETTPMQRLSLTVALSLALCAGAAAQGVSPFEGKSITMIIGYAPGGGTDAAGRLIAQAIAKHLPGSPSVIVQNVPGADGITAMNYFVQQVKPDGLTITMGSSTQGDPINYRKPQAKFDPSKLHMIGGVGRGGSMVVINKDTEKRLYDKSQPPVIMGSLGGIPRSGQQTTAWGIELLGWNAKWVLGYRGTNDLFVALERGEIDMTASSNLFQVGKLVEGGKAKVLTQTGTFQDGKIVARSEFPDVPVFPNMVQGKIKDPLHEKGFNYWFSLVMLDKWLALPPDTPAPMVELYRTAYAKMVKDAEFLDRGKKISEDFEPQSAQEVEGLIKTLADTPPEAFDYITDMLKRQGIGGGG
jgi:tripartite-type tricarboxylate transporter receptor subunit TctC